MWSPGMVPVTLSHSLSSVHELPGVLCGCRWLHCDSTVVLHCEEYVKLFAEEFMGLWAMIHLGRANRSGGFGHERGGWCQVDNTGLDFCRAGPNFREDTEVSDLLQEQLGTIACFIGPKARRGRPRQGLPLQTTEPWRCVRFFSSSVRPETDDFFP